MPVRAIVTRASRDGADPDRMDVVSIVIAVATFAALLASIELLDRV
jgi:hypothetical protein